MVAARTLPGLAGPSLLISNPTSPLVEEAYYELYRAMERNFVWAEEELRSFIRKTIPTYAGGRLARWDWEKWDLITPNSPQSWIPYSVMELWTLPTPQGAEFRSDPDEQLLLITFNDKTKKTLAPFPHDEIEKVCLLLDYWAKAVNLLQPEWAAIDMLPELKKTGISKRQHVWGVMVYGPELVAKIGREKLLRTPTHKVEELPWGGVWVQIAQNPFTASAVDKNGVEKHLDLETLFGGH